MSVGYYSAVAVVRSHTAVVGALRTWVPVAGPAKWPGRELGFRADKSILLLYTVPRLLRKILVKDFFGMDPEVCIGWLELPAGGVFPLVGLSHDKDVISLSKGVTVYCHRLHDDLRIVCGSLVAGRAVIVPFWDVSN